MHARPCRSLVFLLAFLLAAAPLQAKHGAVGLEEKVGDSATIVVATVRELRVALGAERREEPMDATARVVARFEVERVVSGEDPGASMEVGFGFDYPCDTTSFRVGERWVLFLKRSAAAWWTTVNWQFGALRVQDDRVEDPRQPYGGEMVALDAAVMAILRAAGKDAPAAGESERKATRRLHDGRELRAFCRPDESGWKVHVLVMAPADRKIPVTAALEIALLDAEGHSMERATPPPAGPRDMELGLPARAEASVRLPFAGGATGKAPGAVRVRIDGGRSYDLRLE